MAFTVPNVSAAGFADQAKLDSADLEHILAPGISLTGVQDGCAVTAQGTPDMTVAVAAGIVRHGGQKVTVAGGNVTITAADGDSPRFDLITVDVSGSLAAVAGTPAGNPELPDPSGDVVLAAVYVPAADTAIESNQINDRRVDVDEPPHENVKWYGAVGDGVADDTAAIQAAIDAAGESEVVFLPAGTYLVTGLNMSGSGAVIWGTGNKSILKGAAGITGPVLDMTGYVSPGSLDETREFRDFFIQGAAEAGVAKSGLVFDASNLSVRNLIVKDTGGPCIKFTDSCFLNRFHNVVLSDPVSAKANDVAWIDADGALLNGNLFSGLGLRSVNASGNVGVSGAVILTDNGTNAPHGNTFRDCWVEFLNLPTDTAIFVVAGHQNTFEDLVAFDCNQESAATGTAFVRFDTPAVEDFGANEFRGKSLQGGTGTTAIKYTLDINQDGNSYIGTINATTGGSVNVRVQSGVSNSVILTYSALNAKDDNPVEDNGTTTKMLSLQGSNNNRTEWRNAVAFVRQDNGNGVQIDPQSGLIDGIGQQLEINRLVNQNTLFNRQSTGNVGIGALFSPVFKLHMAGGTSFGMGLAASAPADGDLQNGQAVFWVDEANNELEVKVKKSDGTVLTGVVTALT